MTHRNPIPASLREGTVTGARRPPGSVPERARALRLVQALWHERRSGVLVLHREEQSWLVEVSDGGLCSPGDVAVLRATLHEATAEFADLLVSGAGDRAAMAQTVMAVARGSVGGIESFKSVVEPGWIWDSEMTLDADAREELGLSTMAGAALDGVPLDRVAVVSGDRWPEVACELAALGVLGIGGPDRTAAAAPGPVDEAIAALGRGRLREAIAALRRYRDTRLDDAATLAWLAYAEALAHLQILRGDGGPVLTTTIAPAPSMFAGKIHPCPVRATATAQLASALNGDDPEVDLLVGRVCAMCGSGCPS